MNILVIIGNYYPYPSSTANCITPLLLSLQEEGHIVSILTNTPQNTKIPYRMIVNGVEINGIPDRYAYYINKIENFIQSHPKYIKNRVFQNILKSPFYLRYQIPAIIERLPSGFIKDNLYKFMGMNKISAFHLMITISHPFVSQLIGLEIKKRMVDLKWIIYELDPYAFNFYLEDSKRKKYENQESRVMKYSNLIIGTPELIRLYKGNIFSKYRKKMHFLQYSVQDYRKLYQLNEKINHNVVGEFFIAYAGKFYKEIRDPMPALKIFEKLSLNFYCLLFTNYQDNEFLSFIDRNHTKFVIQEHSTHIDTISTMIKADVLFSVGNTVELQVPAKIFEYMGLGKPLIHFSKIKDDPAKKYLENYPFALIINEFEGSILEKVEKIENFFKTMKNKEMSYDEVVEFLPDFDERNVKENFLSIINKA